MPRLTINQQINNIIATKQGKAYVLMIVTAILLFVMILLGIFPIVSAVLFQLSQNNLKQETLAKMEVKRTVIRNLVVQEQNSRPLTLALQSALPADIDQATLFADLNQIANRSQSHLLFVSFRDTEGKKELKQVFNLQTNLEGSTLSLSVSGSRSALEGFLAELEEMRRIFNVKSINISLYRDAPDTSQAFKMDLVADVYYLASITAENK